MGNVTSHILQKMLNAPKTIISKLKSFIPSCNYSQILAPHNQFFRCTFRIVWTTRLTRLSLGKLYIKHCRFFFVCLYVCFCVQMYIISFYPLYISITTIGSIVLVLAQIFCCTSSGNNIKYSSPPFSCSSPLGLEHRVEAPVVFFLRNVKDNATVPLILPAPHLQPMTWFWC